MDIPAIRELQIFLIVAETKSMSQAASRLAITQSAVSQAVHKLELQFDTELLDRSTRPITITAKGNVLYERSRALLKEVSELKVAVSSPDSHVLPRLRMGLVQSFAATIGPHLINQFADMAEAWSVSSGLSARHEQSLLLREVDILVVEGELEQVGGIEQHFILGEPLVLVLPKTWKGSMKSLQLINKALALAVYSPRSRTGQLIAGTLRKRQINSKQSFEFDETVAMLMLVSEGKHWAVTTPLCLMQAAHLAGTLRVLPLPGQEVTRTLSLVAREHELGALPERLAQSAGEILRKRFSPMVKKQMPWAAASIQTG